jgi:hypothetical protein
VVILTKEIPTYSQRNERSSSWLNGVAENFFKETLKVTESFSIFSLIPYFGWTWLDDQVVPVLQISYPQADGTTKTENVVLQQKLLDPLYKATLKTHETSFREVFRPDRPIPSWDSFKDNEDLTCLIGRSDPGMENFRIPLVPTRFVVYDFKLVPEDTKVTPAAGEPVPEGQYGRRCKTSTSIPTDVLEKMAFNPVLGFSIEFTDEQFDSMKKSAFGQKFTQGKTKKKPSTNQTEGKEKMATKRKADPMPAPAAKLVKPNAPATAPPVAAVPVQTRAPQSPVASMKSPVLSTSAKSLSQYKKRYTRKNVCEGIRERRDKNMADIPRYREIAMAVNDFFMFMMNSEEFEFEGTKFSDNERAVLNYIIVALAQYLCAPKVQQPLTKLGEHGPIESPAGTDFLETDWLNKFEDIVSEYASNADTRLRVFDVLNSYAQYKDKKLTNVKNIDDIKEYVKIKIEGTSIPLPFAQTLVLEFISCAMFEDEGGQETVEENPVEEDFM